MNIETILHLLILEIVRYNVDLVLTCSNVPCLICYAVVSCGSLISSGHKVELSSTFGNKLLAGVVICQQSFATWKATMLRDKLQGNVALLLDL